LYLGGEADPGLGHGEPFANSVLDWLLRGDGPEAPHAATRAEARAQKELQLAADEAHALIAVATGHAMEPPEGRGSRLPRALLALPKPGRVLVLRVDAADRLDTSAKIVLQRLLQELASRHLLLLLTTGPDGLREQPAVPRLDLHGLDEATFARFGRSLFRAGDVADPVLDGALASAHTTFSGNPRHLLDALAQLPLP